MWSTGVVWRACLAAGGPLHPGGARPVPTGVLYSIVLLLHVLCAVVGFGAVATTGVQAARARRGAGVGVGAGVGTSVRRYFESGTNWPARALYGVPVFGYLLVAASSGVFSPSDGFVLVGLGLWLAAAVVAEVTLWPGERRIQGILAHDRGAGAAAGAGELDRECRRVARAAGVLVVVFVAAGVVMVVRP